MAISKPYPITQHIKIPNSSAHQLLKEVHKRGLKHNIDFSYDQLKNKVRFYFHGAWSNLFIARQTFQQILAHSQWNGTTQAVTRMCDQLLEWQEQAPTTGEYSYSSATKNHWRIHYTPAEVSRHSIALQFVLDKFKFSYNPWFIPHRVYYKGNIRCYHRWRTRPHCSRFHYIEIDDGNHSNGKWYTYGRNSLGWEARGIPVPNQPTHQMFMLVHEFTHMLESYHSKRTGQNYTSSEMNTTLHELWWARTCAPSLFQKVTPVQDGRKNRWASPVPPLEGQKVAV